AGGAGDCAAEGQLSPLGSAGDAGLGLGGRADDAGDEPPVGAGGDHRGKAAPGGALDRAGSTGAEAGDATGAGLPGSDDLAVGGARGVETPDAVNGGLGG